MWIRLALVVLAGLLAFEAYAQTPVVAPLRVTHGVASGDVTATSIVIWARASRAARMIVEYTATPSAAWPPVRRPGPLVDAGSDFTGQVVLDGLAPDTTYLYWVRFVAPSDSAEVVSETGQFRTAPADGARRPLTLVW